MFLRLAILTIILTGCSGYRFKKQDNPLKIYDIQSLSVPLFINKSLHPRIAGSLTKNLILLLSSYSNLKVYQTENLNADALLLGEITSPQKREDAFSVISEKFTEEDVATSIGDRERFYYPSKIGLKIFVRVVLIKNPGKNSKIIFDKKFELEDVYDYEVEGTTTVNSRGLVNFVRSKSNYQRSLTHVGKAFVTNFKEGVDRCLLILKFGIS